MVLFFSKIVTKSFSVFSVSFLVLGLTTNGPAAADSGRVLTFATYNVLKVDNNSFASPDWFSRRDKVLRTIVGSNADVVGLTEATRV